MAVNKLVDFVELYFAEVYTEGDTTLDVYAKNSQYKLTNQKDSALITSFRATAIDRDDASLFMGVAISNVVENGTYNGKTRYTLTLRTSDAANPMVGMANTDDGTNAEANIIAGNKLESLPKDSLLLCNVGTALLTETLDAFNNSVAESLIKYVQRQLFDKTANVSVVDGRGYFLVPLGYNSHELTAVLARVVTAGTTGTTDVQINRERTTAAIGDSTTQFDITNTAGNTYRYTFDATGTDPSIADTDVSLRVGDKVVIVGTDFNTDNNGSFVLTGVGANYFEITNADGVAETNVTINAGSITPTKYRDMLSTKLTIDSGEDSSTTAATPLVINAALDDLATGDRLRVDIDATASTAAQGMNLLLEFTKPI